MDIRILGAEKLDRWLRKFSAAGIEDAFEFASDEAAETSLNLISEGFAAGTDPYGTPWGAPNNLQITGRMRAYTKGQIDSGGFSVHSTDEKAPWHHSPRPRDAWGGKALPTRLQVPTEGRGLPSEWATRIEEAIEDALVSALED